MKDRWHRKVVVEDGREWIDYYLGDKIRVYAQACVPQRQRVRGARMTRVYEVHVRGGGWVWNADFVTLAAAKKYGEQLALEAAS